MRFLRFLRLPLLPLAPLLLRVVSWLGCEIGKAGQVRAHALTPQGPRDVRGPSLEVALPVARTPLRGEVEEGLQLLQLGVLVLGARRQPLQVRKTLLVLRTFCARLLVPLGGSGLGLGIVLAGR